MGLRFTQTHEWIEEGVRFPKVGITFHAQKELGEIVYIELPPLGKKIEKGEEIAVLESTKAANDVYSPSSGIVVEVNLSLKENPGLINSSGEGDGWIAKLDPSSPEEMKSLLTEEEYRKLVGSDL